MKFGSVCSGIEAASVAWHPLGWQAAWFAEIEPFPSAVLAHHYPGVPNLGDMTRLPGLIRSGAVEVPDILCGGTPCQAFSVAGLRRSLDDERGNLSLTFCEIADAIDEHRPSIIFWENVPGVLNTKDNAFGCFLAGLAGEDAPLVPPGGRWTNAGFVDGPARAVAWRVLDAQYFGVAQRRRRVFVVASARADFDPAAVLFEFEGVRRDSAPRREAGKEVAGTFTARARSGGWGQDPNLAAGGYMRAVAPCVTNGPPFSRTGNERVETEALVVQSVANCLTQRMHKGINSTLDEGQTLVAHALRGEGFDASGPTVMQTVNIYGGNRRQDRPNGGFYVRTDEDTSKTLDAATGLNPTCSQGGTAVMQPVAFAQNQRDEVRVMDAFGALAAEPGAKQQTYVATQGVAPSLTASNDPSRSPQSAEVTQQVSAVYASSMQVRRLTPVECERLQGFPDNYTNIPWRGKPESPDGPRYKALGNSWAVPVVRWIGRRIASALA